MTTVVCVWVAGNVPFPSEYVFKLATMVRRHMDRPYRFVCLTDRPYLLRRQRQIETVQVPRPAGMPGWWSKLHAFSPRMPFKGRVLYLDLDTLVVQPLGPILDYPAPFALVPHAGDFNGRNGLAVVKRFNSSVMVWDGGQQSSLFTDWDRTVTKRLHGDQDWIGEQQPDAATMPLSWFPRLSNVQDGEISSEARVVLCKKPKNIEAARQWEWFRERWQ